MDRSTERQIEKFLGPTFVIPQCKDVNTVFSDFAKDLDTRGVCLSSQQHWRAAWERFENTSEQYIQRIPAIRINNRDPNKRIEYRIMYQRRAVRNFLPYLRKRIPYLTGKAKSDAKGAVQILKT